MREDDAVLAEAPPPGAASVQAVLDDPALNEALSELDGMGRLSDADVLAMRQGRRRTLGAGLASALLLACGVAGWQRAQVTPDIAFEHFETRRGQQMTVSLSDGSRLQLDGATALDVSLGDGKRIVELRQGQAYFDVAHDAARPFEVRTGASSARVLGTAFTVDRGRNDVKLTVYRGAVQFGRQRQRDGVVVRAGWRSRFAGGQAEPASRFAATSPDERWLWIDTDDMQLADLVDVLNRRGGREIAPPPPSLAAISLSGRFRLDDAEGLLTAMGEAYGFKVKGDGQMLRLLPEISDRKAP